MTNTKKLRCYLYLRVSTEMQVEGYSLEAQRDRLKREADHRNMQVVSVFSDEGKSGKNIDGRPAFQEMLQRIKDKTDNIDYVLVFKLSRFGRNAADVLTSLQLMQDFGVNLICVEDGIDSSKDSGKLMISVLSSVAEVERENIRTQTMAGRVQKAREGKWNGGFAPYGYGLKDGQLIVCEKEAEVVRLIFKKYTKTPMGAHAIAKWLNENGYVKIRRQNGSNERFADSFVKSVLDNPVYIGKIAYGRRRNEKIDGERNKFHIVKQAEYPVYEGLHEPIIDNATWEIARAKRAENAFRREKTHSKEHEHVLSGILKCPVCGAPMYGAVNRKKKKDGSGEYYTDMWYYVCKNRKSITGQRCSYKKHLRQDVINQQVEIILKEVIGRTDLPNMVAEKVGAPSSLHTLLSEKQRLEDAKSKEQAKKTKLLNRIHALDPDDSLYDSLFDDLQSVLREHTETIAGIERNIRRTEIAIQNSASQQNTAKFVQEYMKMMIESISELPYDMEKELMNSLLDQIEVFPEPQENGQIVKLVRFKLPIELNGEVYDQVEFQGMGHTGQDLDSLTYQKHAECVVLMSRVRKQTGIY